MRALILLSILVLAGCSTSPVSEGEAKPIPRDRIYASDIVGPAAGGRAEVVFLRDSGYFGSGCSHDLYVNNRKAFAIRQGEGVTLSLEPGSYFFRLETGGGLCPNIATSQDLELKSGSSAAYRILLPSDGSLRLTRIR
ncbi:hypothetical protein [Stutzerimonas nitrititolerans]|uniref:hypothetical protein n=1 Tax=Stutzerimonas nitrititolerans TaxID=2482751 RepID=UPI0028B18D3B|nr:hypothetical protein [Stutzerimonas nitrititolerans]